MGILVQKFGGTSVKTRENMKQACSIVGKYKKEGHDLVIVVSAMGRKGDPYSTDTLIDLCKSINENTNKREMDILMSCGEVISGNVFTCMLQAKGIDAIFLTGIQAGIITDSNFTDAKILDINTNRIKSEVEQGKVVVIAGFQGANEYGDITTLGRGGSDTSAVAIGAYLESDAVEVYTDVDGIMTSDPKVVEDAKIVEVIDYDTCLKMADEGAKVIHPKAVEFAIKGNILLSVKNTFNVDCEGTKICSKEYIEKFKLQDKKKYESYTLISSKDLSKDELERISNEKHLEKTYSKISLIGKDIYKNVNIKETIEKELLIKGINIIYKSYEKEDVYYILKESDSKKAICLIHSLVN